MSKRKYTKLESDSDTEQKISSDEESDDESGKPILMLKFKEMVICGACGSIHTGKVSERVCTKIHTNNDRNVKLLESLHMQNVSLPVLA